MDARLYEFTPPPQMRIFGLEYPAGTLTTDMSRTGMVPVTRLVPQQPVRRFSDESIQLAIDRATLHLEPGTTGAVVAHADGDGVSLSVVAKLGGHWSVAAAAYKPYNGKLSAEAEVVFSWP